MNTVLIIIILIGTFVGVYQLINRKSGGDLEELEEGILDKFSEEYLVEQVTEIFDQILQTDYSLLNLNKYETKKNERNQTVLRHSLKKCPTGDLSSKMYVKDYIRDILTRRLGINENTICNVIPFNDVNNMTGQDKFEVLLYLYKQKFNEYAFEQLMFQNGLNEPIGCGNEMHYEVSKRTIDQVYEKHLSFIQDLTYYDYLDVVTQRIYQRSNGLGAIDEIRDMVIDGVNAGTSGIPDSYYVPGMNLRYGAEEGELPLTSYNAIWVMFLGTLVHLSCIGFGTQKEFERVCKTIYKYNNPGALDASTGKIVHKMKDGSRVTVARPEFSDSWMFFVRKFDTGADKTFAELYPYEGLDKFLKVVKWIVAGSRNIAITGEQYTGKTTFLNNLVGYVRACLGIRAQEMAFEAQFRRKFPKRNIAIVQETPTVPAQDGIDFLKKTDGTINVFTEIAQAVVAALAIQMGEVGAAQVIFTHHAKTTPDLVEAFRDNMIQYGGFTNEKIVEKTVARVLNFDIHLQRTPTGMRYPERITMILPLKEEEYPSDLTDAQIEYFRRKTDRQIFVSKDIIVFEDGKFVFKNNFTQEVIDDILKYLDSSEQIEFLTFVREIQEEIQGV